MSAIRTPRNFSIEVRPFTNSGYWRLTYITLFEKLGGELPTGTAEFWNDGSNESLEFITKVTAGEILITDEENGGNQFKIPFHITCRNHFNNMLVISFACIGDKRFYTDRKSLIYRDGVESAIINTYPGPINIKVSSGIMKDPPVIYQMCETDYELNKRLIRSFKYNTVYGYGWDGLIIKDVMGSKGNGTVDYEIVGGSIMNNKTSPKLKYSSTLNHEPYLPFQSSVNKDEESTTTLDHYKEEPENSRIIMDFENYHIVGKSFEEMMINTEKNTNLLTSGGYSDVIISGPIMPTYRLGDLVKYENFDKTKIKYPFNKYIVASNELFYSTEESNKVDEIGLKFSWNTKLIGVEDGDWSKD